MRATIVWMVAALMVALAPLLKAAAQDQPKIEVVPQIGHSEGVVSVAFSPDGRQVLSGSPDKTLKLWDAASGALLRTLDSNWVYSVAFSPDGQQVLSGSGDKTLKLWDAASGALLRTFRGHSDEVLSAAFSPDGRQVLSGGSDRTLKLWDAASGTLLRTFAGHRHVVRSVAFSPDGRQVLSGSEDKTLKLWDATSGALLRTFEGHSWPVQSVAFSPDGQQVLSGSEDTTLKLWDMASGAPLRTIFPHSQVRSVAFSPDGRQVLSGSGDKTLKLWDATSGALLRTFAGHSNQVSSVTFSPDGRQVLSGSEDKTLKLWDATSGALLRTFEGHSQVLSVAVSPDGRQVLSGSEDKTLKLWDAASGALLRTFAGHRYAVRSVAFSPDGRQVLSGSRDSTLKLWDTASGAPLHTFEGDDLYGVTSVAFSPDGRQLLSGSHDNRLRLWDVASGALLRTLVGHSGLLVSVAFSPDGRQVLSAGREDRTLKLWDAASGTLLRTFEGHSGQVQSVAFSPDGRQVLSGSYDSTLRLWDATSGALLRIFQGHHDWFDSVAFSPDGRQVLSGSYGNTPKLWDAASGALLRTFEGGANWVESVAFSPDGRQVLSGSNDGAIRVWNVVTGSALASFLATPEGDWLAITPEGFFAGMPKGANMLYIVRGLEVFGIDQFYQVLYRPDLVQEKLAGDPTGKVKEAAAKLDLAKLIESGRVPAVKFISLQAEQISPTDLVTVEASLADQGGGIGRVEWRVDGITIGVVNEPTGTLKQAVALDPGENVIELVAYNGANLVSSRPARTKITWNGVEPTARPRLHVLVVGINSYRDGALKLTYAVPDARSIAAAFQEAGREHYEEVSVTFVLDGDATVKGLDRIFTDLAAKIRQRDVFVFFAAGHGKTVDGRYYMLPQDINYQTEQSLVDFGIGQDKLQAWFAKIAARKSVLIFDTCDAGSLTQRVATRGLEHKAALGRLIQATGRATLTATTSTQDAYEGYGGHGVFTFAILDAIARGDTNGNGLIELAELVQHVDGLVPAITEKRWGARQFPQMDAYGSNFSLVRQVAALAPAKGDDVVIPIKPTHVNIERLAIYKEAGGKGVVMQQLAPLTSVTLVKSDKGWVLIAKDGALLGYVAEAKLHKLN